MSDAELTAAQLEERRARNREKVRRHRAKKRAEAEAAAAALKANGAAANDSPRPDGAVGPLDLDRLKAQKLQLEIDEMVGKLMPVREVKRMAERCAAGLSPLWTHSRRG